MELLRPSSVAELDGGTFVHGGTEVVPEEEHADRLATRLRLNGSYPERPERITRYFAAKDHNRKEA